jgi:hypothetical protein
MKTKSHATTQANTQSGRTTIQLIQNSFCLLLTILIFTSPVMARQQKLKQTPKRQNLTTAKSIAAPENNSGSKTNSQFSSSASNTETPSNDPNIKSQLTNADEAFYIKNAQRDLISSGSTIYAYNAKTNGTDDIIRSNAAASNYNLKSVVENIVLDKKANVLYFTASLANRHGVTEFLTWKYDIAAKQLMAYKDGKIESIDDQGNQTIVFEGVNSQGKFTTRSLIGADGKLIRVSNAN